MPSLRLIALGCLLAVAGSAAPLHQNIKVDALIVTKAELRRHLAAPEPDQFRPATYAELTESRGSKQLDYLVLRFLMAKPLHYSGEVEARIDGNNQGTRVNVGLHYNQGWVEYFIPLDGMAWRSMEGDGAGGIRIRQGTPTVTVEWTRLHTK